jgi:hypothetical protein
MPIWYQNNHQKPSNLGGIEPLKLFFLKTKKYEKNNNDFLIKSTTHAR